MMIKARRKSRHAGPFPLLDLRSPTVTVRSIAQLLVLTLWKQLWKKVAK